MSFVCDDLRKDHDNILVALEILERIVESIDRNEVVDIGDLKELVGFFRLLADKCHLGKEEGLLFSKMEKAGIPKENGPLEQMLIEHAEARKYIRRMEESIEMNFQAEQFSKASTSYINLMRRHIDKENKVLFPLGDQRIPMEKQEKLQRQFKDFQESIIGNEPLERYLRFLDQLNRNYGKRS